MAIAVGSSIATVAVLDTNAESRQVMAPKAMIVRLVLLPTPLTASTRNAKRRARPWRSIAWAMMNAPMKTRMVEEPKRRDHVVGRRDADHHDQHDAHAGRRSGSAPPR